MARDRAGLVEAIGRITELLRRVWANLNVPGSADDLNGRWNAAIASPTTWSSPNW